MAREFFSKTFLATFRIGKPLLSRWKEYFDEQARMTLPALSDSDVHSMYRVLSLSKKPGDSPTPREIGRFLNDFAALISVCDPSIGVASLALYALCADARDFTLEGVQIAAKDGMMADLVGPDANLDLAAIHFGVDKDRAQEILFRAQVEGALKGESVESLSIANSGGFWLAFEEVFDSWVHAETADQALLINAAVTMEALDAPLDSAAVMHVHRKLVRKISQTHNWLAPSLRVSRAIIYLMRSVDDHEKVGLAAGLWRAPSVKAEDFGKILGPWLKAMVSVATELRVMNIKGTELRLRLGGSWYILLLDNLSKLDVAKELKIDYFMPDRGDGGTAAALIERLPKDEISGIEVAAVGQLLEGDVDVDWASVVDKCREELTSLTRTIASVEVILNLLHLLDSKGIVSASECLAELVRSGHMLHFYDGAFTASRLELAALCVAEIIWVEPDLATHGNVGNGATQLDLYEKLTEGTKPYGDLVISTLRIGSERFGAGSFLSRIAEASVRTSLLQTFLTALKPYSLSRPDCTILADSNLFVSLVVLEQNLDVLDALIALGLSGDLAKGEFKSNWSNFYAVVLSRAMAVSQGNTEIHLEAKQTLGGFIKAYLGARTATEWDAEIDAPDSLSMLASTLLNQGIDVDLGVNLGESIRGSIEELVNDGSIATASPEKYAVLVAALAEDVRITLARNLLDIGLNNLNEFAHVLKHVQRVLDCNVMKPKADQICRAVSRFIADQDSANLELAVQLVSACPNLLTHGEESSLKNLVRAVVSSPQENADMEQILAPLRHLLPESELTVAEDIQPTSEQS